MDAVKKLSHELWWVFVLQGVVTLLLGIVALFWPGLSLTTLLYAIAFYAILVGVGDLIFGFTSSKTNQTWWFSAVTGVFLIGAAAYMLRNPEIAVATFATLIGFVFVVRGLLEVTASLMLGAASERLLTVVGGVLAVAAGVVIWVYPAAGSLAFVWVLGLFAVIRGTLDIAGATSLHHEFGEVSSHRK